MRQRAVAMVGVAGLVLTVVLAVMPAGAATSNVSVGNNFFDPATATVQVGDTAHWSWAGNAHSVTLDDGSFDSGVHNAGFSTERTFSTAGSFRYYCSVHGGLNGVGMAGTVQVNAASTTTTTQPPPPASIVSTFYFAEGTVRPGFAEFLTLQNPTGNPALAQLTFQASFDGGGPASVPTRNLSLPANSRTTFSVSDHVNPFGATPPVNVSVKVTSDQKIVVERPIYFNTGLAGGVDGGTDVIGATAPDITFLFAEGTVRAGFAEFLTLQNPGTESSNVSLAFQGSNDAGGAINIPSANLVVPGGSRSTFDVNQHVGATTSVPVNLSVKVTATKPIVAERPLYFRFGTFDGGTDVIGSPAAATTFYFAEGTLRSRYVQYFTLQNTGTAAAKAMFAFQASNDGGANVPLAPVTVTVPANARVTKNLADLLATYLGSFDNPPPLNVSVLVTSDQPILVERPLYFNADPGLGVMVDGGTDVIGATATSKSFSFAEGTMRTGFVEYLTLQNPGAGAGTATLEFQLSNDGGVKIPVDPKMQPVPGGSRVTVNVNDYLRSKGIAAPVNVSVKVASDVPLVAERPLYFMSPLAGGVDGGTDVVGFVAP